MMKRFLDYLYSKSQLKQQQEAVIADQLLQLIKRGTTVNNCLIQINELKKTNYAMQMFIEEFATDEQKELIFKSYRL